MYFKYVFQLLVFQLLYNTAGWSAPSTHPLTTLLLQLINHTQCQKLCSKIGYKLHQILRCTVKQLPWSDEMMQKIRCELHNQTMRQTVMAMWSVSSRSVNHIAWLTTFKCMHYTKLLHMLSTANTHVQGMLVFRH